jgi:hypothetical protein
VARRGAALSSNLCHVRAIAADRVASFTADFRHVTAILADGKPAFAPGLASLLGRILVGSPEPVRGFTALACNLSSCFSIHRGKSSQRFLGYHGALPNVVTTRDRDDLSLARFRVRGPDRVVNRHPSARHHLK